MQHWSSVYISRCNSSALLEFFKYFYINRDPMTEWSACLIATLKVQGCSQQGKPHLTLHPFEVDKINKPCLRAKQQEPGIRLTNWPEHRLYYSTSGPGSRKEEGLKILRIKNNLFYNYLDYCEHKRLHLNK